MLASWTKVLPFIIIEWFAKRKCERFGVSNSRELRVSPYKNVEIFLNR